MQVVQGRVEQHKEDLGHWSRHFKWGPEASEKEYSIRRNASAESWKQENILFLQGAPMMPMWKEHR